MAYFDGPGGTQVPREVTDAMPDYLLHHNANTHWAYPDERRDRRRDRPRARAAIADFLNARADEIAFGQNMTSLTFHLARAHWPPLEPGDEIVVTELDHHANVAPWRALAPERGVTVRMVRMHPDTGQLDWEDLERSISNAHEGAWRSAPRPTRSARSTTSGAPRGSRTRPARSRSSTRCTTRRTSSWTCAPSAAISSRARRTSFTARTSAFCTGRASAFWKLDVPRLEPAPDTAPERLETGTQNHEGIVGAAAAVDFLASLGVGETRRARLASAFEGLHARGTALVTSLWNGLTAIAGVRVFGPPPAAPRTPTIAFVVAGRSSTDVARRLADRALYASNGDFYAATVIERIGMAPDGVVRAGCACYTTEDEVDRLISAVAEIAKQ